MPLKYCDEKVTGIDSSFDYKHWVTHYHIRSPRYSISTQDKELRRNTDTGKILRFGILPFTHIAANAEIKNRNNKGTTTYNLPSGSLMSWSVLWLITCVSIAFANLFTKDQNRRAELTIVSLVFLAFLLIGVYLL